MRKKLSLNLFKSKKGMTLLEIMIVLAIIGGLLATILPGIMDKYQKSKIKQAKITIGQIISAIGTYQIDCGKLPQTLENLAKANAECSAWGPDPYMKKIPKDPWGNEFSYEVDGTNFVIKSPGYKGKEITSEDLE